MPLLWPCAHFPVCACFQKQTVCEDEGSALQSKQIVMGVPTLERMCRFGRTGIHYQTRANHGVATAKLLCTLFTQACMSQQGLQQSTELFSRPSYDTPFHTTQGLVSQHSHSWWHCHEELLRGMGALLQGDGLQRLQYAAVTCEAAAQHSLQVSLWH